MTFAEGVLRLVRTGARVDPEADSMAPAYPVDRPVQPFAVSEAPAPESFEVQLVVDDELARSNVEELVELGPGLADIEAAVALIEQGLARRVVLTGFPSWPGLLWQAYQLAEAANVVILPTVVRPGGRVDIVIERVPATDG
jgi:hypothetical protein